MKQEQASQTPPIRGMRALPLAETGQPAPFRLGAPAYLIALGGWLVATGLLVVSAPELARLYVADAVVVGAAHAVGLVFFPFAVAAAAWQLLPVMLRNDPPHPRLRWLALAFLAAGIPLAVAVGSGRSRLAAASAAILGVGLVLLLVELGSLVHKAPRGRLLVVSRLAVMLAGMHVAAAFALGVVVFEDGGRELLGAPYERLLLVHLSLALVGWLTVMILAVGRTLVPMLGLAAAAPRRRAPLPEVVLVVGLWVFAIGLVVPVDALVGVGLIVMVAGLAVPAALFFRVARTGKIGVREGPVAHVVLGLAFLVQAAGLALAGVTGILPGRRAAVAGVLLLGIGWVVGVIVGHLGKLISLSGWGSWPPGPRPKQAALYPRRGWQIESIAFAAGVELLAVGVVAESAGSTRAGAALLFAAAVTALACAAETVRRVVRRA